MIKETGNSAYHNEDFHQAIAQYSQGIGTRYLLQIMALLFLQLAQSFFNASYAHNIHIQSYLTVHLLLLIII